ncbi:hypothetical protein DFH07DRAFT_837741 [Mycena maculata]|uniref:Uncharacterized protein n=1 Tax=Mycena maculata TaxID=230809 RepID=A0AAD7IEY7_9AGAR|nr:hypothetical protein DFH07DRAFT_837741 [Mycena maculata]
MSYFGNPNPTFPSHPPGLKPRSIGVPDQGVAWISRRSVQFEDSHRTFPCSVPDVPDPLLPQPRKNAWDNGPPFNRAPPGYMPLQPVQPVVPPMQWDEGFIGNYHIGAFRAADNYDAQQQPEYYGPAQHHAPSHLHASFQTNGTPHRGRGQYRGQLQCRGYPPPRGHSQFRGSSHPRGHPHSSHPYSSPLKTIPEAHLPPDPEKTPTPQDPRPDQVSNRENPAQHIRAWKDWWECPQASGRYMPPPLPPVDLDLVAKVGDIVRVKPWADQFTWIEGRVEKADFSLIKNHKPSPRYSVVYRHPETKQEVRRVFCPHLFEIMVREPNVPGAEPLPDGIDRDLYACIPPFTTKKGQPIEKIWTHAQLMSPPDVRGRARIRIVVGPSRNIVAGSRGKAAVCGGRK